MSSFLRMRQPAITRLNPHAGNPHYIIPNILGRAGGGGQSSLHNGLLHQSDVNTDGRTDDAPFDHIASNVATLVNLPTVVVGDGGYDGMNFVTASQQYTTMPGPVMDWTAPVTIAARARTTTAIADNSVLGAGSDSDANPLAALKITRSAAGQPESFWRSNAGGGVFTLVNGVDDLTDDVEHVIIARSLGGGTGRVQMIVDQNLQDDVTGSYSGATSIDNVTWGAFFLASVAEAWGTNVTSWVAIWDRLLTNEEVVACSAQPNPFGRSA